MSSWGLRSVTFKQDHSPLRVLGPTYTHCQSLGKATAPTVAELLSARTKRTDFTPPTLTLHRGERPKPAVPTVTVMNTNGLRILKILLKALQITYLLFDRQGAQPLQAQNATGREHLVSMLGV